MRSTRLVGVNGAFAWCWVGGRGVDALMSPGLTGLSCRIFHLGVKYAAKGPPVVNRSLGVVPSLGGDCSAFQVQLSSHRGLRGSKFVQRDQLLSAVRVYHA